MRKRLAWNKQEQDKLRELWDDGMTPRQIANIFGTSRKAIDIKASRMNLPRRIGGNHKATEETLAIANNLYRIGVPVTVIAKRLGVGFETIKRWTANPPKPLGPARNRQTETAE